jgi:hypothetical protein
MGVSVAVSLLAAVVVEWLELKESDDGKTVRADDVSNDTGGTSHSLEMSLFFLDYRGF